MSRQGIDEALVPAQRIGGDTSGALKIGYFGRIHPTKGPDLLARALSLIPKADVRLDIHGVRQPGAQGDVGWLEQQSRLDARLRVLPAVAPSEVMHVMTGFDLVAIPSQWLETGPLVALEAFGAGVPVLGSDRGGIAEVVRDGVDGMLVAPDDPAEWASAIDRLAGDRAHLCRLRAGVVPPRTMTAAADEMADLYARIAAHAHRC